MTIQDRLKTIEIEVVRLKVEAELDERYKDTSLPIRCKLWLWDIKELRKIVGSEVAE